MDKLKAIITEAAKLDSYLKLYGNEVIALISSHDNRYFIGFGESPKGERVVFSVKGLVFVDENGVTKRKAMPIDAVSFAHTYAGREITTVVSWFVSVIETLR